MAVTFYPPLSSIVTFDELPDQLSFVKDGLSSLFDKIYFRDLQFSKSPKGDSAFYSLVIVSKKRLAVEIPGTGLFFILNPAHDPSNANDVSEIPISVRYEWKILGLLKSFDLDNFSFSPSAFFDIILQLANMTEKELIKETIENMIPDGTSNPIQEFVNLINAHPDYTGLPVPTSSDPYGELATSIETQLGDNASLVIFAVYLFNPIDEDSTLERINKLFSRTFGDSPVDYIKELLIPKIDSTLDVSAAIEFPRSILVPLDAAGEPESDTNIKSRLEFDPGFFYFSTERGIGFEEELTVQLSQDSQIGQTGLIITLEEAKLDLSKETNIPEATADGRPNDFVGVYIKEAAITLPARWFKNQNNTTAKIFGRRLLMGTGGISGQFGLEATAVSPPPGESPALTVNLGSNSGFEIGFESFDITFQQNEIISSSIAGYLKIPGFNDANGDPAKIEIDVSIGNDGDFSITAKEADGFKITFGSIFSIFISSLSIGRQDDEFFLSISGKISFEDSVIANVLKGDIEIKKLTIWSDGKIELEGGTLPLPKGTSIKLGPAEISITAIHFGSHQEMKGSNMRKYNYFGFDGGLNVNPGGVDARGDGIKFYYSVDSYPLDTFLRVQSIAIDLIIPGTASPDTATALIKGYLALKGTSSAPEYEGGVEIKLPKARIAGGAAMKYNPSYPAFIIDAYLEMAVPLPIGATGLGIYGFRGLLGLRYVATKDAVPGLTEDSSWYDYYKAPPQIGVNVSKFRGPNETDGFDNPFSIGAGASLATTADDGKAFSTKLFVLLSLPSVFLLEGKANVLGTRVGLDSNDPPFFAFLAFSSSSVEAGFGADYKVPADSGAILKLYAEVQAGFFFQNPSAWYINFGTKQKPISARLLSLFDVNAYLMLSAAGIEAAARIEWKFDKKYAGGAVRAYVNVYAEVGGRISFAKPQIGGYAMLGGGIEAYFLFLGFNFSIDTTLMAEAPKPFLIEGSVRLCVGVTIGFWKFKKRIEKCFDVKFRWEKSTAVDRTPIKPFEDSDLLNKPPVKALSMLSGEDFDVHYFGTSLPAANDPAFNQTILPLDSFLDISFKKSVLPDEVNDEIGGRNNAPTNYEDLVPPKKVNRQVVHEYSIRQIELKAWNGSSWVDYHPYEALANPTALAVFNAQPSDYKMGHWQKSGKTYDKIRLLSETSLSYMEQGETGWYTPEEFGITAASLFCEGERRKKHCVTWEGRLAGYKYDANRTYHRNKLSFRIVDGPGEVLDFVNVFGIPRSLAWLNEDRLLLTLNKPSVEVELKLFTYATGVTIQFFEDLGTPLNPIYNLVSSIYKSRLDLLMPVSFESLNRPISRIVIVPDQVAEAEKIQILLEIERCRRLLYEAEGQDPNQEIIIKIRELELQLVEICQPACINQDFDVDTLTVVLNQYLSDLNACQQQAQGMAQQMQEVCDCHDQLRAALDAHFTYPAIIVGYEMYQEIDQDGIDEYRFRLRNADGEIVMSSSKHYHSEAEALEELQIAIECAKKAKLYEYKISQDNKHYFNIIDEQGEVVARRIEYFNSPSGNKKQALALRNLLKEQNTYLGSKIPAYEPLGEVPTDLISQETIGQLEGLSSCISRTEFGELYLSTLENLIQSSPDPQTSYQFYTQLCGIISQAADVLTQECEQLRAAQASQMDQCDALQECVNNISLFIELLGGEYQRPAEPWRCSTLLHEVCWITLEDWEVNIHIPTQQAIQEDYQATRDAIQKMLAPIWRPDTQYVMHLKVADRVDGASSPDEFDYYFGFKTVGPLGYFHKDPQVDYVPSGDNPDQYALTSLRAYIDYKKSYPNADGNLVNAKPLLYKDTRLLLFYTKRYAYHLLADWPSYKGLPALTGDLKVVIKDPIEDVTLDNPPPPNTSSTAIPQTVEQWERDDDPRMPADIRALRNLSYHGGNCLLSGGDLIVPASVNLVVTPNYLKPLKLYTAIFLNRYQGGSEEVHRYAFQTSRYGDFPEQINSYLLDDGEGHQREAVFPVEVDLSSSVVDDVFDLVTQQASANTGPLAVRYTDPFDRLLEGLLKITPLDPPMGTEFNIVRNSQTNTIIGIWIRNPEPFNDPKIPSSELMRTMAVMNGSSVNNSYHRLYAKDASQVFIMHQSKTITASNLDFRFIYLEWDGSAYIDKSTVNINNLNL